ncbi:MAG: SdpI family protein [Oscillospiraceae bacterium]|nr:SdpI family protein [Oscillospiraceae bacterium]
MIKNNKKMAILSSVVALLPILLGVILWNRLPETMISHWGGDGVADGTASKAFMVFGMPLIFLALHWLCILGMTLDKKSTQHNRKIVAIIFWMIPVLSCAVNAMMYGIALEKEWNFFVIMPALIGVLFLLMGNYLPKTTRNRTMGIKLRWTMGNDENWQKTHRLGGRLWVVGGILLIFSAFLPMEFSVGVLIAVIAMSVIVPTVYSYRLYKKHKAAGIEYEPVFDKKSDKIALWITAICVPLILIGTTVLMLVGDVSVTLEGEEFVVEASFSETLHIPYENVDSVEYRDSFDIGNREYGFGSPRLSTGVFQNKEFGRYTLYAYTNGEGCIVLRRGDEILVIALKTAEETKAVYDSLAAKVK